MLRPLLVHDVFWRLGRRGSTAWAPSDTLVRSGSLNGPAASLFLRFTTNEKFPYRRRPDLRYKWIAVPVSVIYVVLLPGITLVRVTL